MSLLMSLRFIKLSAVKKWRSGNDSPISPIQIFPALSSPLVFLILSLVNL